MPGGCRVDTGPMPGPYRHRTVPERRRPRGSRARRHPVGSCGCRPRDEKLNRVSTSEARHAAARAGNRGAEAPTGRNLNPVSTSRRRPVPPPVSAAGRRFRPHGGIPTVPSPPCQARAWHGTLCGRLRVTVTTCPTVPAPRCQARAWHGTLRLRWRRSRRAAPRCQARAWHGTLTNAPQCQARAWHGTLRFKLALLFAHGVEPGGVEEAWVAAIDADVGRLLRHGFE